jgi:integrase
MPSIEYRPDRPKPYRARYWGPDGRLHSRSFARRDDAEHWLTSEEASKLRSAWVDPRGSRRRFDDWATQWWELRATEPRRSPAALEAAESHLRLHIRPYFGRRPLGTISAQVAQRWQNELEGRASHNLTMACRSILNRILEAAEAERLIPVNPVRKVRAPRRPVDPEVVFGRLLVGCPAFYRDHFIVQVGTGLRSGELLGLRARRVDLAAGRIEVVDVRYDAGRFGSGYKDRPKSDASIRAVPMAEPVAAAMARRLEGCGREELVFCGRAPATASPAVSAPGCRSGTTGAPTGWRWPGPSCPSWTRTAPTTCATPSRPGWRTEPSRPG